MNTHACAHTYDNVSALILVMNFYDCTCATNVGLLMKMYLLPEHNFTCITLVHLDIFVSVVGRVKNARLSR